ncbi:unnamed protein product, partial [Amoebophrya sp. A25]|eukprot:GSA25T00006672001.1
MRRTKIMRRQKATLLCAAALVLLNERTTARQIDHRTIVDLKQRELSTSFFPKSEQNSHPRTDHDRRNKIQTRSTTSTTA